MDRVASVFPQEHSINCRHFGYRLDMEELLAASTSLPFWLGSAYFRSVHQGEWCLCIVVTLVPSATSEHASPAFPI